MLGKLFTWVSGNIGMFGTPTGTACRPGYFFHEVPSRVDLYIRGVIDSPYHLDFGIGTFFVPEGTGGTIERADDVKVVAVLDRNGRAVIKQLLVDGQPFEP